MASMGSACPDSSALAKDFPLFKVFQQLSGPGSAVAVTEHKKPVL
jgi:hypothetical protein